MKKMLAIAMTVVLTLSLAACGNSSAQPEKSATPSQSEVTTPTEAADGEARGSETSDPAEDPPQAEGKVLIAYFSKTGNTETIANMIARQTGGELFKVETVTPYPEDYNETVDIAREEQDNNARPALSTHVEDMSQYDIIYLGYPNWWGTMPQAMFTFLEEYDFSGKTFVPFCTHGGSALGSSERDLAALVPDATLLPGLAVSGSRVDGAEADVKAWIEGLNLSEQAPAPTPEASSDVLIVYYSYSGVTEGIAQMLQAKTGGDLYEIEVTGPYPDNDQETSDRAAEERVSGNLPALNGELPVLDGYDVVLVGGPVWTSTLATPLMSYLEQIDFGGKTVAPFWTDAGNSGNYAADFSRQVRNGEVTEGLGLSHVSSYEAAQLEQVLDEWLSGIGLAQSADPAASEIRIAVGDTTISAELNDSDAAREFAAALPLTVSMTRMGEHEYYGSLEKPLTHTEDLQIGYTVGDLAFWTPGDLFAVYFDEPEEAPEGLMILGQITSDLAVFNGMEDSVEMRIEIAE